jgi:hypothetical protein
MSMPSLRLFALTCGIGMLAAFSSGAAQDALAPADAEVLVAVRSAYFDRVMLRPAADLRNSDKVILEPAQVVFRSDWLSEMNKNRIALLQGTTPQDAERVADDVAKGFDAALATALARAGYELTTAPVEGAVRLSPRIVRLYVNAPRSVTTALPSRVYTTSAGEATFELSVRDAVSGRVLAHVVDTRQIGDRGDFGNSMRWTTTVSNAFDFDNTFEGWARGSVKILRDLRKVPGAAVGTQTP